MSDTQLNTGKGETMNKASALLITAIEFVAFGALAVGVAYGLQWLGRLF